MFMIILNPRILEDTADVDTDIYIELHQLMYCYYFEATRPIFQPMNRAVCLGF